MWDACVSVVRLLHDRGRKRKWSWAALGDRQRKYASVAARLTRSARPAPTRRGATSHRRTQAGRLPRMTCQAARLAPRIRTQQWAWDRCRACRSSPLSTLCRSRRATQTEGGARSTERTRRSESNRCRRCSSEGSVRIPRRGRRRPGRGERGRARKASLSAALSVAE